jgi:hypothetical protein
VVENTELVSATVSATDMRLGVLAPARGKATGCVSGEEGWHSESEDDPKLERAWIGLDDSGER